MPPVAPFSSADPNAYIALGMQSGLGTPQVTPSKLRFAKYLKGTEFNLIPAIVDLREGGDGLDFGTSYKKQQKVQGTLQFYLRPEIAGQFFQGLPGGATWFGGSLAPTVNQLFHDNHASHPYMTMFAQHPGSSLQQLFSDLRFTGFTLSGQAGEPWQIKAPFTAITFGASAVGLTPTYFNIGGLDDLMKWHDNASYVIDGVGDTTIESLSLDFKLGVEEIQAQGVSLDDIAVMNRELDVQFTRRYQSPSAWQKIAYGAAGNITPTTSVATGSLGFNITNALAAGNLRALLIACGMLTYRYDNLTQLDPDGQTVKETISARAMHTATSAISLTLTNTHASAYAP